MTSRVLVVDDYPDTAETLAVILKLSDYEVEIAGDGPAALAAVEARRPDIVILDIELPGMDGWEVAKLIRGQSELGHIPIIVLSGHGESEDRQRSEDAGCDLHLVKPFDPLELVSLLQALRRAPAELVH